MEINGEDGSKLRVESGQQKHFGRGNGSNPSERTVSRRHVSFQLVNSDDEIRVQFQVIGKNPVWVHYNKTDEIKIFRFLEDGEMESGDMFCVSGKKPMWFALKRLELDDGSGELGLESQLGQSFNVEELDSIDVSGIDPVKEFGFVVMGHELDCYPKKMILDIKNWDWFIDEPGGEGSENDEVGVSKRKGGGRRKRKKSGGVEDDDDDDEWTGESDEDIEVLAKSSKVKRPKYSTRSKGSDRPIKAAKIGSNSPRIKDEEDDEGEDNDEDDETLGGFIVDKDSAAEELENDEEEDEEEEFEEEDDEEE